MYLVGKTFKAREFSKRSANVSIEDNTLSADQGADSDSRDVGVLCTFFTYNHRGKLTAVSVHQHKFVDIKSYFGTISAPVYVEKVLTISKKLVEELVKASTNLPGNCYDQYCLLDRFLL